MRKFWHRLTKQEQLEETYNIMKKGGFAGDRRSFECQYFERKKVLAEDNKPIRWEFVTCLKSRIIIMLSDLRKKEVQQWLTELTSVENIKQQFVLEDQDWFNRYGESFGLVATFEARIINKMQPGDEVWLYNSGPESWKNLCGQHGIALVRNGEVIQLMLLAEN